MEMLHLCISGFWERLVDVSTVTGVTNARPNTRAPAWRAALETSEKHERRGRHGTPNSAQKLTRDYLRTTCPALHQVLEKSSQIWSEPHTDPGNQLCQTGVFRIPRRTDRGNSP